MRKQRRVSEGLLQGLREAAEHSQGKRQLREHSRDIPGPAPKWTPNRIKNLRNNVLHLSQPLFAAMLNVTTSTVRSWEQGQKRPSGAAARLLQLLEVDQDSLSQLIS